MSKILGVIVIFISTFSWADSITLHLMRSPLGINWSSPWTMTMSTLKNAVAPTGKKRAYSISHVFVEVKCDSTGDHIYRGMTSAGSSEERELLFKKGYGLGLMFHTYKGKLEKGEQIPKDLAPYLGHKRRAGITIKTSPETCQRMLQYAQEYEAKGYGSMYSGLQADPLKGEGAGCSAFGVSFLRIGGLMGNFTQEWKDVIDVPKRFVGGPLTGKHVKITKLLSRPFARWSSKTPHIHLEAWNPERMHTWVKKTYLQVRAGEYRGEYPVDIDRVGKSYFVELDMSDRPTPQGSFWIN